jgi:hypothetical protein
MRRANIQTGKFYRVKMGYMTTDVVRVDGFGEPRWPNDKAVIRATRFMAGGSCLVWLAPREVGEQVEPSPEHLAVMEVIEGIR